jgi:phosphoglycerate dehydrogenase-like enzyme
MINFVPSFRRLHPQVVVTPHVSGLSFPRDIAFCFKENYERFVQGKPLANTVDWKNKY